MRRSSQTTEEPSLFDLPLVVDPEISDEVEWQEGQQPRPRPMGAKARQIELPVEAEEPTAGAARRARLLAAALIRRRFQAGLIDSAFSGVALSVLVAGTELLGAAPRAGHWPAYLVTLLLFSFFYVVFSLTFWGHTLGMIRAHLVVGGADGRPVTTGQAVLRWLGGVITVALLGLPTFLALRDRRSLADHLSGTRLNSGTG